jgi:ribosome maturation factor RimP
MLFRPIEGVFCFMNFLNNKISILTKEISEECGFMLIDIVFRGDERNRIIQIFIDGETGISVDDCAVVSSKLSRKLEEQDFIPSNYRLEVSSPGTDRPLKFLKQYIKHIDRKFEVEYLFNEEKKKFVGKLVRIAGEDLFFIENKNEIMINFNNIKSAKVLTSF